VTGGGAFNSFLLERCQSYLSIRLHIPSAEIINYKEAIVMGFIGVLRLLEEVNVLASVTGAKRDTSCGDIYNPKLNKLD
jgi:anhydro-N-acetylmuramic acid kinase